MKSTKIMLAVLGTFIATWLLFGWVPGIIVGSDLNDKII